MGRATRAGYVMYLSNLLPVYQAMERLMSGGAASPAGNAFADPRLARAQALRRDLHALGEDRGGAVLPEAAAYAAAVAASGVGLVGHAYARYLGDLSGGQILKPFLARSLGLTPGPALLLRLPRRRHRRVERRRCAAPLDTVEPGSPDAVRIVEAAMAGFPTHHRGRPRRLCRRLGRGISETRPKGRSRRCNGCIGAAFGTHVNGPAGGRETSGSWRHS